MGLDLSLRAIPDDDSFEVWTERYPDEIEDLQFIALYFSGERGTDERSSESDRELRRIAVEIQRRHPGIESRYLHLDRAWDVLHFVLSPARRSGDGPGDDPGTLAVRGTREYHPQLMATQGSPIRYLSSSEIPRVLTYVSLVTRRDIAAALRQAEDRDVALHKFSREYAAAWLDELLEHRERMIRFYQQVLENREAVLFIKD